MPRKKKSFIASSPIMNDFILTFQGVSCGILGDQAYTVEEFKTEEQLLKWAEHTAYYFNKIGKNMDKFVEYIKSGKVRI